jgi:hypothetical protein
VARPHRNGPAERAGIAAADVVEAIASKFPAEFERLHRRYSEGDQLIARVRRGKASPFTVEVRIGAAPGGPAEVVQRGAAATMVEAMPRAGTASAARVEAREHRHRVHWRRRVDSAPDVPARVVTLARLLTEGGPHRDGYINYETGEFWPSVDAVMRRLECRPRTVSNLYAWLIKNGFVARMAKGGNGRTAVYKPPLPPGETWPSSAELPAKLHAKLPSNSRQNPEVAGK